MKERLIAAMLAVTALAATGGCASVSPQDYISHGNGRAATTVLGALAGGLGGNALEHNATAQTGDEEGGPERFEAGQRVRVLTGARGARVEHA